MTASNHDREVPAWAVEDVHLVPYDTGWTLRATNYTQELHGLLDPWLLHPIEHIGSTAIPGAVAKPVIDLMAMVEDKDVVLPRVIEPLHLLGWRYVPPVLDGREWRRFFVKVSKDEQQRLGHLHLVSRGAERWDQQSRFRDALRANDVLRDEYSNIKTDIARRHASDREAYTDEKADFVSRVMRSLDAG